MKKVLAPLIGLSLFVLSILYLGLTPVEAASGEKIFKTKCAMCHSIEEGKKKIGPSLYGIINRPAGKLEGYKFSKALTIVSFSWDEVYLTLWLSGPKLFVPGTKMKTRGIKKQADREALIEYLREATKPKEE